MPIEVANRSDHMWSRRGQTLYCLGQDTTGTIEYRLNQQGFRSDVDYDFAPDFAFFGCSLVVGVGVSWPQVFTSSFPRSHNYGLCGHYSNHDIYQTIRDFIATPWYSPQTKITVVWTDRGDQDLDQYHVQLPRTNIVHFFCGDPLPHDRCYRMLAQQDRDVSGTHMGPASHQLLRTAICQLFDL